MRAQDICIKCMLHKAYCLRKSSNLLVFYFMQRKKMKDFDQFFHFFLCIIRYTRFFVPILKNEFVFPSCNRMITIANGLLCSFLFELFRALCKENLLRSHRTSGFNGEQVPLQNSRNPLRVVPGLWTEKRDRKERS